jgi:RNA polymerase sigma-70 factor, ECF subfamily
MPWRSGKGCAAASLASAHARTEQLLARQSGWLRPIALRKPQKRLYEFIGAGVYFVNVDDSLWCKVNWCEQLYERKAAELILYGRALGLSHSEAEDVLQETFVALLKREAPPEQPDHYCIRSFRNRALNFRRGLWRRLARELESVRWFEPSAGETAAERAAMSHLTRLPPEQREVIVLKIWHGHTFEEIGEMLDLSPNTVAGRYRYGLQKLNTFLKGQHEQLESFGESIAILDAARSFPKA